MAAKPQRTQMAVSVALPPLDAEDLVERVVDKLANHFSSDVEKQLAAMVQRVFDERVQKAAEKAVGEFLSKRIPQTNQWGERVNGEMSVTEYVLTNFEKYMKQKVDNDGRPSSYSDRGIDRHQWLIQQFGLKEIEKVAANEIGKVRKAAEVQIASPSEVE